MSESIGQGSTNVSAISTVPGNDKAGQSLNQQAEIKPYEKKISDERSTSEDYIESQKIVQVLKNDYN